MSHLICYNGGLRKDKISNELSAEGSILDILETSDQWAGNALTRVLRAKKKSKVPYVDN